MQEIANTASHTLTVDITKNRIYFIVTADNLLRNSSLFQDWEKAKRLVYPGFTVLTDVSRIQNMTGEWVETSVTLQKMLIKAGLAGTAEVLSERVAKELQINHINRIPGNFCYTKEEVFTDRKVAEAWLDKISQQRK